jgi:DNA-binding response OmpR family regulator
MGKKALFINNIGAYPTVARLLTGAGFEVDVAADPETGLKKLAGQAYDIAVVIEGYDSESWRLYEEIKSLRTVPLIVIGASTSPVACARAIYAGADFFMKKPFGPQEFLARVNSLMQRSPLGQAVPIG